MLTRKHLDLLRNELEVRTHHLLKGIRVFAHILKEDENSVLDELYEKGFVPECGVAFRWNFDGIDRDCCFLAPVPCPSFLAPVPCPNLNHKLRRKEFNVKQF